MILVVQEQEDKLTKNGTCKCHGWNTRTAEILLCKLCGTFLNQWWNGTIVPNDCCWGHSARNCLVKFRIKVLYNSHCLIFSVHYRGRKIYYIWWARFYCTLAPAYVYGTVVYRLPHCSHSLSEMLQRFKTCFFQQQHQYLLPLISSKFWQVQSEGAILH